MTRPTGLLAGILASICLFAFVAGAQDQPAGAPATDQNIQAPEPPAEQQPASSQGGEDQSGDEQSSAEEKTDSAGRTLEERRINRTIQTWVIVAAMAILGLVAIALYRYIVTLRQDMAALAIKYEDSRQLFLQMALGVPDGTIRSALAIMIVLGALLALVAAMGADLGFKVPETLAGVFGTILGFYFGRAGGVEASQATAAMAKADKKASDADKKTTEAEQKIVQAQQEVAVVKVDAQKDVAAANQARFKTLSARVPPIVQTIDAVVDFLPAETLGAAATNWPAVRQTLLDARDSGSPEQLQGALESLAMSGPITVLLENVARALQPMTPAGKTPTDVARSLIELSASLPPEVAQRWALRVLGLPYRGEIVEPVIDEQFASTLVSGLPLAGEVLKAVNAKEKEVPLSETDFLRAVLTEGAETTLTEMWQSRVPAADVQTLVTELQKRAIEYQLERELPPQGVAPLGAVEDLFKGIDAVRSTDAGQRALDALLVIVRRARSNAAPVADLLSPAGEGNT